MFDTVSQIPLSHELFAQAIHPKEPIISVGLASGHVWTYRLPPVGDNSSDAGVTASEQSGFGTIGELWHTKRHKGSCRTLGFGADGAHLYSAGTDGLVKVADVGTGQVISKIAIPLAGRNDDIDPPTIVHPLTPQSLLLTTDSGALHLYDIRELATTAVVKPKQSWHPHDDYISSITPLPPSQASTSGFPKQWVSTGGTTLAVTDLRRGVMVRSEPQEEELLSSVIVTGLSKRGTNVGEKVVIGGGTGVLTLWERGVWDDQDERITLDRAPGGGESVDSLAIFPDGVGPGGHMIAAGLGNGELKFVQIQPNRIVSELKHDELQAEAVVGLGFDVAGRLISGGGKMVKIWHEKVEPEQVYDEDDEDEETAKRQHSDSDSDEDEEEESSEDERANKKRKKRKRNKGKKSGAGGNGIMGFKGLE
ncbi:WD repeat-containing protein JIP5 [Delitschia confertaspora ATCC 74209]|uniref:WD repeat-containing protein JIP5 n=1 Tax=Delitschia confertaspora ATCC 74209 TaxID=1513339 RepID=A0A9P4MVJ6_9PLEO|nr:WD repeat-containing protein JIP5 [Delitschia confertaspora ATCC 74209]